MIHNIDEAVSSEWRQLKDSVRRDFMTEKEMMEVNTLLSKVNNDSAELQSLYPQWAEEEEAYSQDQALKQDMPNSRINVILPTIEGEVTQIVDNNWQVSATGEGPEDDQYAENALIGLEWALKQNDLFKKGTVHERRRMKHGVAYLKVWYDHGYASDFGCPMLKVVPIHRIIVDGKIKDFLRWQEADYIIEVISYGRTYAEEMYGEDKAQAINYGVDQYRDSMAFHEDFTTDDEDSFTLLEVWSRRKGKLRCRHITACGTLLYDSAKEGSLEDSQKDSKYHNKSVYKYVSDKYPIFITNKYTLESRLQGFGDAKLLLPIQNMINELYDKIRIQMRPNLILVDRNADVKLDDFDENSFKPKSFDGNKIKGASPIHSEPWGAINADMFHLLQDIKLEAQRIARFNDIMTGQGTGTDTATEAAIQQQQGNSHTAHEKTMFEHTLGDAAKYMLALMMEYIDEGRFFKLYGERAESAKGGKYAWVDFSEMTNIPGMVPASKAYTDKFRKQNPGVEVSQYEVVESGKQGKRKAETKILELDVNISLGSGLPKNKAFLWQMLEKLSQLMGIDIDSGMGQPVPKPLITWKEMRKFIKEYMDIPIDTDKDMQEFVDSLKKIQEQQLKEQAPVTAQQTNQQPSQQPGQGPAADQNLTQGGNAQLEQAAAAKQGGAF